MRTPGTTPPRVSFTLLACSMVFLLVLAHGSALAPFIYTIF